jgi:hypothetical protein
MSAATYNERLHSFNILVKAKNFLVFQGDVEAVASQGAKELSKLIDQISGSLEYKDEYERAKAAQDRAVENSTFTFNKRKGINAELKTFREQKSEAERFEKLQAERVSLCASAQRASALLTTLCPRTPTSCSTSCGVCTTSRRSSSRTRRRSTTRVPSCRPCAIRCATTRRASRLRARSATQRRRTLPSRTRRCAAGRRTWRIK